MAFESDERTREVLDRLLEERSVMPSSTCGAAMPFIRLSVSSWRTAAPRLAR